MYVSKIKSVISNERATSQFCAGIIKLLSIAAIGINLEISTNNICILILFYYCDLKFVICMKKINFIDLIHQ